VCTSQNTWQTICFSECPSWHTAKAMAGWWPLFGNIFPVCLMLGTQQTLHFYSVPLFTECFFLWHTINTAFIVYLYFVVCLFFRTRQKSISSYARAIVHGKLCGTRQTCRFRRWRSSHCRPLGPPPLTLRWPCR
jgi:hypothetical protein